jgi:hypothetical protein
MGNPSYIVDTNPWAQVRSSGFTFDANGNATTVGGGTLFTKWFRIRGMPSFSFFVQGQGTGVAASGWVIQAKNNELTSADSLAGTAVIASSADFGSAGTGTAPGIHRFASAFSGNVSDYMSSWVAPYNNICFLLSVSSGTETIQGQFFCSEV